MWHALKTRYPRAELAGDSLHLAKWSLFRDVILLLYVNDSSIINQRWPIKPAKSRGILPARLGHRSGCHRPLQIIWHEIEHHAT